MEALLQPNTSGCESFEVHPFKPGLCKACGANWKLHKGIIDDGLAKQLYEKDQKVEADKQAKAAAKAKDANTFENRQRKAKEAKRAETKDDWFNQDESGKRVSRASVSKDSDSDGEGFTMQVITPTKQAAKPAGPVKAVVIRNLLDDFDEMNTASPVHRETRPPLSKAPGGTPSNAKAPVPPPNRGMPFPPSPGGAFLGETGMPSADTIRLREELAQSKKAAQDARNDLEDKEIELDMLKEDMKDLKAKLERNSHIQTEPTGGGASNDAEVAELKTSLEAKDKEIERLTSEAAAHKESITHLEAAQSGGASNDEEVANLKTGLETKDKEIERLTTEAAANIESITRLESAVKESADASTRLEKSESELAAVQAKLAAQAGELEEATRALEELKRSAEAAAASLRAEHEALLGERAAELAEARQALEELKLTSTRSTDELAALTTLMEERATELQKAVGDLEAARAENSTLTKQIADHSQSVEQLNTEKLELEANVSQAHVELGEARQRNTVHVEKIDKLEKETEELAKISTVLSGKEEELERFKSELEVVKEKEAAQEVERERTAEALAELEKLRAAIEEKEKVIEEKDKRLLSDAEAQKAELATSAAELEQLRAAIEEKEKVIEEKDKLLLIHAETAKAEVASGEAEDQEAAIESEKERIAVILAELEKLRAVIDEKEKIIEDKDKILLIHAEAQKAELASSSAEVEKLRAAIEEKDRLLLIHAGKEDTAKAGDTASVPAAEAAGAGEAAAAAVALPAPAEDTANASPSLDSVPTLLDETEEGTHEAQPSPIQDIGLAQLVDAIEQSTTLRDELIEVIHKRGYLAADGASAPEDNHEPNEENADVLKRQLELLRQESDNFKVERDAALLRATKAEAKADIEVTQARRQGALVAAHAFREVRQNAETQFAWLFDKVHKAQAQTAATSSGAQRETTTIQTT